MAQTKVTYEMSAFVQQPPGDDDGDDGDDNDDDDDDNDDDDDDRQFHPAAEVDPKGGGPVMSPAVCPAATTAAVAAAAEAMLSSVLVWLAAAEGPRSCWCTTAVTAESAHRAARAEAGVYRVAGEHNQVVLKYKHGVVCAGGCSE
jgi:hypothetical protein